MPKPCFIEVEELPLVLTMDHVSQVLGIARARAYELAYHPTFPAIKIGRTIRVPREAFFRWIEQRAEEKEESA